MKPHNISTNLASTQFIILVSFVCLLPFILNLFGIDFTSYSTPINADSVVNGKVVVDDVFLALKGALHHTLLEWSAVSIAILAMLLSFMHYAMHRNVTIPIIGVALFCAGLVDAFHTLAATRIIQANAPNTDFIPFTWALSRTFNASILICGALISLWISNRIKSSDDCLNSNNSNNSKGLITITIVSTIFVGIAYMLVRSSAVSESLPQTMYPEALITRPFDILPLALFMVGATLFWIWYKTDPSPIKFA